MRDRVMITFGRQEYALLPAFSVQDEFEDRCGALTAHLLALTQGTATLHNRATLVYLAMKAGFQAGGDGSSASKMTIQHMKQSMWEEGSASDELMLKEVELIERLLYTPEQYLAKKMMRDKAEEQMSAMSALLSAFPASSDSPPGFSDGSQPSSGEAHQENSSPV